MQLHIDTDKQNGLPSWQSRGVTPGSPFTQSQRTHCLVGWIVTEGEVKKRFHSFRKDTALCAYTEIKKKHPRIKNPGMTVSIMCFKFK